MIFRTTWEFLRFLEARGELVRVKAPADPVLEIPEIACRVMEQKGPALLFERPVGSDFPVAVNMFGTHQRLSWALGGRDPGDIGEELSALFKMGAGVNLKKLASSLGAVKRLLSLKPRTVSRTMTRIPVGGLSYLPVLHCWPRDGGRFFTLPIVRTEDPDTGVGNCGMYRLQVYDERTTGMHWHPHRGGAAHYAKAEAHGQSLPVAVILGGPPALTFATVAPLPPDVDEYLFAGWLMGEALRVTKTPNGLQVPRDADFVLWGHVPPGERRLEGPFGDHFGYYSLEREFPIFRVEGMLRRPDPVFPATVVGKPPKEDGVLGKAVERMFTPLIRLQIPELVDLNTPLETGFHNLAVASARFPFPRAGVKLALGLWGLGAMALTKTIIVVDEDADVHRLAEVWRRVSDFFKPSEDLILVPEGPADTLDFSSPHEDRGSKMAWDATRKPWRDALAWQAKELPSLACRWEAGVLFAAVDKKGPGQVRELIRDIWRVARPRVLFITDADVDISSETELLWAVFSRFDPKRDSVVSEDGLCLAVDATRKTPDEGHERPWPGPTEMSEEIKEKVNRRWGEYGI